MKIVHTITRYLSYIGAVVLFLMMCLTVVDVFLRFAFNSPIPGTIEVSALMLVIVVGLGLGWCALERSHVKVDLITSRIPRKTRLILSTITLIMTFLIYGLMTWFTLGEALESKDMSSILLVPMTPFQVFFWAGLVIFCVCIIVVIIEDLLWRDR